MADADPFTPDEIAHLSSEIDEQLRALGTPGTGLAKSGGAPEKALGVRQRKAIEQATGQEALSFLRRFKEAARQDLCLEGGVLYAQWRKWKDVTNKDVLRTFGAVLAGMGLSGSALQVAVVAIAVYALYLGVQAFCEEV
jgi:hypothetical protein